jgi:hypothetical protein
MTSATETWKGKEDDQLADWPQDNLPTAYSSVVQKLIGSSDKKLPPIMEPQVSLSCSQAPTVCLYPKPGQSSLCSKPYLEKIFFNIMISSMPKIPQVFPQNPVSTSSPQYMSHAPPISLLLIWSPR